MTGRLLHLSDLHVGANDGDRGEIEDAVRLLSTELDPELVLCSGDLSHRNRREQHERAAAFLRSLGRPLLVVPGNHDLPALPPARFATPFVAFHRVWPEPEPGYLSGSLAVVALNSVRPLRYQRGALEVDQLEHAASVLEAAPAGALRVVALHHHLTAAPWRTGKRSIPRRAKVLSALAAAGAELVVSGHIHQASVVASAEFLGTGQAGSGVVLATAPGLGRPRPGRHAEACGLNVYEARGGTLRVRTYSWSGHGFIPVADRRLSRG
ncbi:MAG: metallophosphoesterase [Gaiellales bacterium]